MTFRYRTSDTGKLRTCTLPAEEFIRRFLQHVLPKGFIKVRYYGFLSPGYRRQLAALRQQLNGPAAQETDAETPSPDPSSDSETPGHVVLCPSCGRATVRQALIRPTGCCPP